MAEKESLEDFLKRKRINLEDLQGAVPKEALDVDKARFQQILNRRIQSFPYSNEQVYRVELDIMHEVGDQLYEVCYKKCNNRMNTMGAMTSVQEGRCIRTCLGKFNAFFPSASLQNSAAQFYLTKYKDMVLNNHPHLKEMMEDPLKEERSSALKDLGYTGLE